MSKAKIHSDCGSIVNMREEAKTNSAIAEKIPTGTLVEIRRRNKEWSSVQHNGKTGYIMNQFLIFGEK